MLLREISCCSCTNAMASVASWGDILEKQRGVSEKIVKSFFLRFLNSV